MNKIVEELGETVKEYLELLDDSIPIANYHMGSVSGLSQEIYNHRKKLGLFTLDDIEIDMNKTLRIIGDSAVLDNYTQEIKLASAIAIKKPIKVKKWWNL